MRCEYCREYEYQWVLTGKGAVKKQVDPAKNSRKRKPVRSFICGKCIQKGRAQHEGTS